ncbi:MAG: hypothetical protein FVQ80_07670 [Planctomycetes bacterium]|nr:hypothetical protein [Planctomycetota bacterium]
MADRLPYVAQRYRKSPEQLEKIFLNDNDLALDHSENLFYSCSFVTNSDNTENVSNETIQKAIVPYDQTFLLHSNPGATKVIYLDFDGHTTTATPWNEWSLIDPIVSLPYDTDDDTSTFSDTELGRIQNIWARVAEDFIFYDVDVTTADPGAEALEKTNQGDKYYGIRTVISPSNWAGYIGGIAFIDSFKFDVDTPVFVFYANFHTTDENYAAEPASHEIGHALGLYHDGKGTKPYYWGHGQWGPIMGVAYAKPVSQWSKGEYPDATNTEDDLAIMSLVGGFDYRPDDCGNTIASAKHLTANPTINAKGIIEKNTDADVFSFTTGSGNITITAEPQGPKPNLDILIELLKPDGIVIAQADNFTVATETLNANLSAGTYYIRISGVGDVDYTDYASLGRYTLQAAVVPTNSTISIEPKTINTNSPGQWITCNIKIPDGYTIADIDKSSIRLADLVTAQHIQINPGQQTVTAKFDRAIVIDTLILQEGLDRNGGFNIFANVKVTGQLNDATPFEGTDKIRLMHNTK